MWNLDPPKRWTNECLQFLGIYPISVVVSTHLKNISQIGSFPQVGMKVKNVWNHHPAKYVEIAININLKHLESFSVFLSHQSEGKQEKNIRFTVVFRVRLAPPNLSSKRKGGCWTVANNLNHSLNLIIPYHLTNPENIQEFLSFKISCFFKYSFLCRWWFNQPIWRICASQIGASPNFRGKHIKWFKPTARYSLFNRDPYNMIW